MDKGEVTAWQENINLFSTNSLWTSLNLCYRILRLEDKAIVEIRDVKEITRIKIIERKSKYERVDISLKDKDINRRCDRRFKNPLCL